MKILLDCVYTGLPSTCSTSYLMWELIERWSEEREDVFFTLLAPGWLKEPQTSPHLIEKYQGEIKWLERKPDRVSVIYAEHCRHDRIREYYTFSKDMSKLLSADRMIWDHDAVVTSRTAQITDMKGHLTRMSALRYGIRPVIGLEEMTPFSFRETITTGLEWLDMHMIANYLNSGGVICSNLWTKRKVLQAARKQVTPSKVKELEEKIYEATPVPLGPLLLPPEKHKGDKLTVAFTGRITGTRRFQSVLDLFRKHFAYAIGKDHVEFVVSTNSMSTGASKFTDIDFLPIHYNSRDEFYAFLESRCDVVVNLSAVEEFSLSTYEPLRYGVPVITSEAPWTDFLGPSYPFRVSGEIQAYALVQDFIDDYVKMAAKFHKWAMTEWLEEIVPRWKGQTTYEVIKRLLDDYEQNHLVKLMAESDMCQSYRTRVQEIVDSGVSEINLYDDPERNHVSVVGHNAPKFGATPLSRVPSAYLMKVLMNQAGFKDQKDLGVFRRS